MNSTAWGYGSTHNPAWCVRYPFSKNIQSKGDLTPSNVSYWTDEKLNNMDAHLTELGWKNKNDAGVMTDVYPNLGWKDAPLGIPARQVMVVSMGSGEKREGVYHNEYVFGVGGCVGNQTYNKNPKIDGMPYARGKHIWYPYDFNKVSLRHKMRGDDGNSAKPAGSPYLFYQVYNNVGNHDGCFVKLHSKSTPVTVWVNEPSQSINNNVWSNEYKLHPGANMIMVLAKEVSLDGPGGVIITVQSAKIIGVANQITQTDGGWMVLDTDWVKKDMQDKNITNAKDWVDRVYIPFMVKNEYIGEIVPKKYTQYNFTKETLKKPFVRYIRVQFEGPTQTPYIQMSQLAVYPVNNSLINIAKDKPVKASSVSQEEQKIYDYSPENAVDGVLVPRRDKIYKSSGEPSKTEPVAWKAQFWEIDLADKQLGETHAVYKVVYYNRKGINMEYAAGLQLVFMDEKRQIIYKSAPFGDASEIQEFYFNRPTMSEPKPDNPFPIKKDYDDKIPPYPVIKMPTGEKPVLKEYKTPQEELLKEIRKISDELIELNRLIQQKYAAYIKDKSGEDYEVQAAIRRGNLIDNFLSLVKKEKNLI